MKLTERDNMTRDVTEQYYKALLHVRAIQNLVSQAIDSNFA